MSNITNTLNYFKTIWKKIFRSGKSPEKKKQKQKQKKQNKMAALQTRGLSPEIYRYMVRYFIVSHKVDEVDVILSAR